jgi:basic amino acid/polyamine antiporter, APA family
VPGRWRRREVELERVLGTPALVATAYGNVGSSIYYALGLTPPVFVVAGGERFATSRLIIRA